MLLFTLLLAITLVATSAVQAEVYTINLNNGTSFDTRYMPTEASFDETMITFLSEAGNRIALSKSDVGDITVLSEVKGFGMVIDTSTIDLGIMPNDMPTQDEVAAQKADALSPFQETFTRNYDQQQFVEPGAVQGGIPVFGVGGGTVIGGEPSGGN